MYKCIKIALTFILIAIESIPANASFVQRTFVISSTNFSNDIFHGGPPPIDTILGSFTVRFDKARYYYNETNGINANYFNFVTSPLAFNYEPDRDFLIIGSLAGYGYIGLQNGSFNDFIDGLYNATSPTVSSTGLEYGVNGSIFLYGHDTIMTTPLMAVPEPMSWAMMIIGLALTGVAMRRRYSALQH